MPNIEHQWIDAPAESTKQPQSTRSVGLPGKRAVNSGNGAGAAVLAADWCHSQEFGLRATALRPYSVVKQCPDG
ncbi:MAG: hypothetical protein V4719_10265 [Planctomycetota bacterium]